MCLRWTAFCSLVAEYAGAQVSGLSERRALCSAISIISVINPLPDRNVFHLFLMSKEVLISPVYLVF